MMMNTPNPYLYEELWREHQQQMRRQVAINCMVLAEPRNGFLHWSASLLLRMGTALQRYRDQQLLRTQAHSQIDTGLLNEYHLSR
ncbi:MAG: hypothetical protein R2932_08490 [Caldilineaceae bacterium]